MPTPEDCLPGPSDTPGAPDLNVPVGFVVASTLAGILIGSSMNAIFTHVPKRLFRPVDDVDGLGLMSHDRTDL